MVFSARIVRVNVAEDLTASWCEVAENGGATVLAALEGRLDVAGAGEGFGGVKPDFPVAGGAVEWVVIFGETVDDDGGPAGGAYADVVGVEEVVVAAAGVAGAAAGVDAVDS